MSHDKAELCFGRDQVIAWSAFLFLGPADKDMQIETEDTPSVKLNSIQFKCQRSHWIIGQQKRIIAAYFNNF